MPTILFQTPPAGIEQYLWPAAFTFVFAAALAVLAKIMSQRKERVDIHRTEMELAFSILNRLEPLKMKSLEDEATIRELQRELTKCLAGQDCRELKDVLLVVLPEAARIVEASGNNVILAAKMRELELRLG